jgi:hypothetical protein
MQLLKELQVDQVVLEVVVVIMLLLLVMETLLL